MAYITEMQKSRKMSYSSESASTTRNYNLVDFTDTIDALAALTSYVPPTVQVGQYICTQPEFDIDPDFSDPDRTMFTGTVKWKTADKGGSDAADPQEPEDNTSFSFSFSSIEDVKLYSAAGQTFTPEGTGTFKSAINQQHSDAMPEGMAVNKAIVTITAKTVISANVASNQWFKDRLDQVWTLNQSEWRSLPARSVAFTGLEGSLRSDGNWDITYSFEYRPDNPGQTFETNDSDGTPKSITTPSTGGWDYVWASWDKYTVDDDKTRRVINSVSVVQDVYPTSDFDALGMVGV